MRKLLLIILSFILVSFANDQIRLKKREITKGISVKLPSDFELLNDDELASKYFTPHKPIAAYSSPDRYIDFGVNKSITQFRESDLEIMKGFYKGSIQGMFDQVKFLREEIKVINKRKFIVFEFVSTLEDKSRTGDRKTEKTTNYTLIQYTIQNGKTFVFNFSCPAQVQNKWQPVATLVMESIKISKTLK